jgi:hypothetical protein
MTLFIWLILSLNTEHLIKILNNTDCMAKELSICSHFEISDNDMEYDYLIWNPGELRIGFNILGVDNELKKLLKKRLPV